jgi:thiamine-monophosphate kinase
MSYWKSKNFKRVLKASRDRKILEHTVIDLCSKYFAFNKKRFPYIVSRIGMDDSAILELNKKEYLVISIDAISSRPLAYTLGLIGPRELGHYVVYANISDIASNCARPLGLMLFMGLPRDYPEKSLREIILGVREACSEYQTCILGGDTKYTSKLQLLGTALGVVGKDELTTRYGAKPGDIIVVTGYIGTFTAAGYAFIKKLQIPSDIKKIFINALKYPKAALRASKIIAKFKGGHGGIDISDGLVVDLYKLVKESKVGAVLYEEKIPIHPAVQKFSRLTKINPMKFAFGIGGDWQCIFTINPNKWDRIKKAFQKSGIKIFEIGEITSNKKIKLVTAKGEEKPLECRGHIDDLRHESFEEEIVELVEE